MIKLSIRLELTLKRSFFLEKWIFFEVQELHYESHNFRFKEECFEFESFLGCFIMKKEIDRLWRM